MATPPEPVSCAEQLCTPSVTFTLPFGVLVETLLVTSTEMLAGSPTIEAAALEVIVVVVGA